MGKIWLKSVDPARQCCGCEGKVSPCDSCCSFDLTDFEGRQVSNSAANTIFEDHALLCRFYFPKTEIKDESQVGEPGDLFRLNKVMSLNYDNPILPKTYIDADQITFYHVDGYKKEKNGTLIIETEGDILNSEEKIKPKREEFCDENRVVYQTNPPLEYDIVLSEDVLSGEGYDFSDELEEIDAPEAITEEYSTEEDFSEIRSDMKITTEICCNGQKYKFATIKTDIDPSNFCESQQAGVYKGYTFNTSDSAFGYTASGFVSLNNLRFDDVTNTWLVDFTGQLTLTSKDNPANILSSLGIGFIILNEDYEVRLGIGRDVPIGASNTVNSTLSFPSVNFPIPLPVRLGQFFDAVQAGGAENLPLIYILPDCESIINSAIPTDNFVGDYPECDPNYICIRKDNITKYQEILQDGIGNNEDCVGSDDTNLLEGQEEITPSLLGIIGLSLVSIAGGGAAGLALVAATGVFGLALAAGLYYYSVKVGAQSGAINENGESSYEEIVEEGEEDPSCEIIGEGNILKTTEIYSVIGKKIIFPFNGGPPEDILPYAPKYKLTREFYSSSQLCVRIKTEIKRKEPDFNGVCVENYDNFDNIAIAYRSIVEDEDSTRTITKPVNIEVTDNSVSIGYRKYNCSTT